jgi:hypothetical protein
MCHLLPRVADGAPSLQPIHVEVPRKIYVNCRKERGLDFGRLVKHTLPHRRPTHFLYELTMPERRFLRYTKDLARLLSDPDVEGVYETKVQAVCAGLWWCVMRSHWGGRLCGAWKGRRAQGVATFHGWMGGFC